MDNAKQEKPQLTPLMLSSATGAERYNIDSETLIGREVECAISLDSPHISRYHAKIAVTSKGTTIEDLKSSNGTYVNGKRINEKTAISIGDEIRFDSHIFRLTSSESGNSDTTIVMKREKTLSGEPAPTNIDTLKPNEKRRNTTDRRQDADDDATRMLNTNEMNKIATINQHLQHFTDEGSGPRFVATSAPIRGKVFPIDLNKQSPQWQLGRSPESDICVSDPSVSRSHAQCEKNNDSRFYIWPTDQNQTVLINGIAQQHAMLKHNDHIQIGNVEFVFRIDEQKNTDKSPSQNENTLSSVFDDPRIRQISAVSLAILVIGLGIALSIVV